MGEFDHTNVSSSASALVPGPSLTVNTHLFLPLATSRTAFLWTVSVLVQPLCMVGSDTFRSARDTYHRTRIDEYKSAPYRTVMGI